MKDILGYLEKNGLKITGVLLAVVTALIGQAELIGEPWHHYLSIIGIVLTAVIANQTPAFRTSQNTRATDPAPTPPSGA